MGRLAPIVQSLVRSVIDARAKLAFSNAIAAQFIRDDDARRAPTLHELPQEPLCSLSVRRDCTRISSVSALPSTARQSQCFFVRIVITTSSRCHLSAGRGRPRRILAAICVPNFATQSRIVSWLMVMPRSARRSSTSRRLRAKRWYAQRA